MGKKRKLSEPLREFYRGVPAKPDKDVDETEMQIIIEALKLGVPNKSNLFKVKLNGKIKYLKLHVGLREGLRCLKRKQTWAIIYDDTAGQYLQNYLNEFAQKSCIPSVRAKGLIDIAPKLKLNSMLLISFVIIDESIEDHKVMEFQELTKLCQFLSEIKTEFNQNIFLLPAIEKVPSRSKKKKAQREDDEKLD